MTDHESIIQAALEDLVPLRGERQPDWQDVMARSGSDGHPVELNLSRPRHEGSDRTAGQRRSLRRHRRVLILAIVVVIAMIAVVLAVGATAGWWFARAPVPAPAGRIGIVSTGTWDGQGWQLVAYRATTGEICYSLALEQTQASEPSPGAFSCADLRAKKPGMAALAVGRQQNFPAYLTGPVVGSASVVLVSTSDGGVVETQTVPAPDSIGPQVRFFALQLPCGKYPVRAVGITDNGERVADLDLSELTKQQEALPNRCTSP